ncbi:GTPase family protein [Neisseria perflava]|uniref:GTPase family protein n=1 Tax=Neisseria perflava TaxID=33053 RepID=UPI00209F60B3|nr:GTPase [Neisseria perflava]MCP1660862.1 putative GTPase [Neisseria perflava]MCP1772495.1 putative GTPase [Neisseria perflava]
MNSNSRIQEMLKHLNKEQLEKLTAAIRNTKINVLLVGGTGVGKSSTINALFDMDTAKVGQGTKPETSQLESFEFDHIVIWDTPRFGDSEENDKRYKEAIVQKLNEKDKNGLALIDLVLLIIDGSSRDYSSAYTIIKDVVYPNLGETGKQRLLVGINQADLAMKGRHWNHETNQPEQALTDFLEEKVQSTRERIKADTGLDVEPIYYAAGYKDGDEEQHPYNLEKLLSHILEQLPEKKRFVFMSDVNDDKQNFSSNDGKEDYSKKIEETVEDSFWNTIKSTLSDLADMALNAVKEAAKEMITPENVKTVAKTLFSIFSKK